MNVLALENGLSPHGGQEVSLLELCQNLSRRGHKIHILYRRPGELLERYREFCKSIRRVSAYSIDRWKFKSYFDFFFSFCKGLRPKPDLIYTNQIFDSMYAGLLSRVLDVPYVCHLRLPPPETLCTQFRIGLSNAAQMIAVSDHTRQSWVRSGAPSEKITMVYNGISLEQYSIFPAAFGHRLRFGIPQNAFVVTYAGRITRDKGLHTLLKAFGALKKNVSESFLVIASSLDGLSEQSQQYFRFLKSEAKRLAIDESILWLNRCSEMTLLFNLSDITVLPSLWPEPFGRVLIESMACGTPALGSRVGGIPEVLTGEFSDFLFEPDDVPRLSGLLIQISDWRKRDPGLAERCRRHVGEKFALDRCVDSVEGIFLKAVRHR